MMRTVLIWILLFTVTTVSAEDKTPQQRVDDRKLDIAKKKPQDRAEEYAKLALELTELASDQYAADKAAEASQTFSAVGQAAADAVHAAKLKRKHVKKAEIKLRECSRKLDELKHRVRATDQAPVTAALEAVERARSQLLEVMFGK